MAKCKKNAEKPVNNVAAETTKTEVKQTTFDLNAKRPNVKAGNLSDKGRQNKNGGFNRNQNGFNRNQNGQNGRFNKEGSSGGFNGAQARQSYQNRERDNNQNRQGGFNKGQNGFNRNQNGQGFNKGTGQGGFNRGSNGQGGGFRPPRPGMGGGAAPLPIDNSRTPSKKAAFKGKKQVYNRKMKNNTMITYLVQRKRLKLQLA